MATEFERLTVLIEASVEKFNRDVAGIAAVVDRATKQVEQRTGTMTTTIERQFASFGTRILRTRELFGPLGGQVAALNPIFGALGNTAGGPLAFGLGLATTAMTALIEKMKQVPEISDAAKKSFEQMARQIAASPESAAGRVGADLAKQLEDQLAKQRRELGQAIKTDERDPVAQAKRADDQKAALDKIEKDYREAVKKQKELDDKRVADRKAALEAIDKAERQFRDQQDRRADQRILDQVDLEQKSVEATAKFNEDRRKDREATFGEMSAAEKKYFDDRMRIEEDAAAQSEMVNQRIAATIADFGSIMDEAGGKFGKAVELMILDLLKFELQLEATKALSASLGDIGKSTGGTGIFGALWAGAKSLLHFQTGGSPPVNMPVVVGESGPEIFVPRVPGTIVPSGVTAVAGPMNLNIYQTITGNGDRALAEAMRASAVAAYGQVVRDLPAHVARISNDPLAR